MSHDLLHNLQSDLRNATVKEITDCIKALNDKLEQSHKLLVSGKKDEVVARLANYVASLVNNERHDQIYEVIRTVNEIAPRKLAWRYENRTIRTGCQKIKRSPGSSIERITFMPSPFIKAIARLTSIKICPVAGEHRQSKSFTFTLSDNHRKLLASANACDDRPVYQIRFFCSKYTGRTENLLVEFPGVCELKVNDSVIPGHTLRCLKGKPGTVNPPDVSVMSRKHAQNTMELIYINSDSPFIASAFIVERTPVQGLIDEMKANRVMTKERVLEKLREIQDDADVIMESETVSTKCPLAFTRIVTPVRSRNCNHLQCFDAFTYLTMNEQTPTWTCPVCYRRLEKFEDLIIDEYFTEMLKNTPKHIDSVRVEPNGTVTIIDENPDLAHQQDSESEDEQVEVEKLTEPEITILLDDDDDGEIVPQNIPATNRPSSSELVAESSSSSSSQQPPRKRAKTSDVIDLTLSSDEDDDIESLFLPHTGTLYSSNSFNNKI